MAGITALSIRRPVATAMAFLILIVIGVIATVVSTLAGDAA